MACKFINISASTGYLSEEFPKLATAYRNTPTVFILIFAWFYMLRIRDSNHTDTLPCLNLGRVGINFTGSENFSS